MAYSATFVYEVVDGYSSKVKATQKATKVLGTTTRTAGKGVDSLTGRLGKMSSKLANLRTGFAATMLAMGLRGAVKASFEFETIMNKVEAVTQATTTQMSSLRKEAKKQGLETRFSAVQAAQGMEMLGVRGYKTYQILKLLPSVLTMATAGDLEMSTSSEILTGTLKTFNMGVDQANRVVDVYAVTAANTASNMTDLNSAMKNFGPLGHAAGMQFEEMAALVGALSDKNIRGSAAGTLLMNSIRNLIKPTNEAIEVLQDFGFRKDEVTKTSGEIADLTTLLGLFEERGLGVGEIFRIFQVRGAKAVAALRGQVPVIRELIKKYEEQAGAGKTMADIMEQKVTGSTHRAISAWEGLKTAIGKGMEPMTMRAQELATSMFKFIADDPARAKTVGWLMTVAVVLLTLVTIMGVVFGSIHAIALGIGTIGTAIVAVKAVFVAWGVLLTSFGIVSVGVFAGVIAALAVIALSVKSIIDQWDKVRGLGGALLDLAGSRGERKLYEEKHKEKLEYTLMERAAMRAEKTPLSASPESLLSVQSKAPGSSTETAVSININNNTGGSITVDPNSGDIPVNIRSGSGYGTPGSLTGM